MQEKMNGDLENKKRLELDLSEQDISHNQIIEELNSLKLGEINF